MEIRCAERLHFILIGDIAEVKCKSKRCGAGGGTVVLHRFNIKTGEPTETLRFKDPQSLLTDNPLSNEARQEPTRVLFSEQSHTQKEEEHSDDTAHCAAVRSA